MGFLVYQKKKKKKKNNPQKKIHKNNQFKLRKDFNNSDLGALDFIVNKIIDKNHRSPLAAGQGLCNP
jgi:hypothetical protein